MDSDRCNIASCDERNSSLRGGNDDPSACFFFLFRRSRMLLLLGPSVGGKMVGNPGHVTPKPSLCCALCCAVLYCTVWLRLNNGNCLDPIIVVLYCYTGSRTNKMDSVYSLIQETNKGEIIKHEQSYDVRERRRNECTSDPPSHSVVIPPVYRYAV